MSEVSNSLRKLDYSILQQCIHCGMCLPTCPTYDATKVERNSPRGRISLMHSIADGDMEVTKTFGDEIYFCLGCLACETACPAGVDYTQLFEMARATVEKAGVLKNGYRETIRTLFLRVLFTRPRLLRFVGRLLWIYQVSGLQSLLRKLGFFYLLPKNYRELEKQTPDIKKRFSNQLISPIQRTANKKYKVGVLTGCIQDLIFSEINRDTVEVLTANQCEVHTPSVQFCCGSLHAHNGDLETARLLARRNLDTWKDLDSFDAIITNAAGCGSHLKHYDRLLQNDPVYRDRAALWSKKIKDIQEWLVEIQFHPPTGNQQSESITYHEACHLCHGQKITQQPRQTLKAIPGIHLVELPESTWCCGSAGIYNITQPEMSQQLLERKIHYILSTGCKTVTTANPGCLLQLISGFRERGIQMEILHPVSLLAKSYRANSEQK